MKIQKNVHLADIFVDGLAQDVVGGDGCVESSRSHAVVAFTDLLGDDFQRLGGCRLADVYPVYLNQTP